MKNLILIIVLTMGLSACSDKVIVENHTLTGDWNLIATYADPGDGSGTWNEILITVIQRITFKANGDFDKETISGFDYESYQIKNEDSIVFKNADGQEVSMKFKIEGNVLTLSPQCIEGCGFRFKKLSK